MSINTENILDQKFEESYKQLEKERKRNWFATTVELFSLACVIVGFLWLLKFVFWGAGFATFAPDQHEYTVSILTELPGPQKALVERDMVEHGFVSLVDYRRYVEMANEYKARTLSQVK